VNPAAPAFCAARTTVYSLPKIQYLQMFTVWIQLPLQVFKAFINNITLQQRLYGDNTIHG
jgi:hypothetical protein